MSLTIFVMAIALLVQTPMVQTYIANKLLEKLSEQIDGEITFEKIHFKPFRGASCLMSIT